MYRPSELQHFLKERGAFPKKGLSQNFLIDGNIIRKIIELAAVKPGDFVIEIGPGPGALTQLLLERGAHVLAIEIDSLFARELSRLQTEDKRLEILCSDALTVPYENILKGRSGKVVANLPYHITTPLLVELLPLYPHIESLTLMVQQEFAKRMYAQVGTSDYSSLTLLVGFYAEVVNHFVVGPNCFYPKPSVHSSVVHCQLKPPALTKEREAFFRLTRTAFQHRRKMLRAALRELYAPQSVEQALTTLGVSSTARPEELSLYQFIDLFRLLR
jgi:16S rRNA (adenine1518-N6/adenine1519-N6)-dimethyltransferase